MTAAFRAFAGSGDEAGEETAEDAERRRRRLSAAPGPRRRGRPGQEVTAPL